MALMSRLKRQLELGIAKIPGMECRDSKVAGGSALFYGSKEIAHFHSANAIDIRLTQRIIKDEGLIQPEDSVFHRRSGNSQWIELRFTRTEHVANILRLARRLVDEELE